MGTYHTDNKALHTFYSYWQKMYPALEDFHMSWIEKAAKLLRVKKGQTLYESNDQQQNLYIVLRGHLVKELHNTSNNNKQILTVALPNMGFFTTMYYHSQNPAIGNIVTGSQSIVLQIPYKKIKPYYSNDKGIDTLLNLIVTNNKDQLDHLRVMDALPLIKDRLFYLADHLPELYRNLSRRELARLLHVSESSIYRAKKKLLHRRDNR